MEPVFTPIAASAKLLIRVMGWRMLVTGIEHLPRHGPAVVVSNHVSYLDPIVVGWPLERIGRVPRFLAKRELFEHRLLGPMLRSLEQVPVDRGGRAAESLDVAAGMVGKGEVIVVFPEGTISTSFVPADPKSGAARLALRTGAPLVPVALWGGQRILTKGRPRRPTRGVVLAVGIGEPVHPVEGETADALTGRVWQRVTELVDEAQRTYPQQPRGQDDAWWLPRHLGGTAPSVEEAEERRRREAAERRARRRAERPSTT